MKEEIVPVDWLKQHRPHTYAKMLFLQKRKKLPSTIRSATKQIDKLDKKRHELKKLIYDNCPHVVNDQQYVEMGREDTLGNYKSGSDCWIKCARCNRILDEWIE